jgi:6-pyruvoyltetrahydropterin/6-carboxytetrahydropterin synthase
MYEVGIVTQFEAAHRLIGDFGPATSMHGHTYRLEVTVRGERLAADGTLVDIGMLRAAVDALAATLHYQDLTEVPSLAGVNTTMEAVARHCWEVLAVPLRQLALTSLVVRVWESPEVFGGRDAFLVEPG